MNITKRRPTHPGIYLMEFFIQPLDMTVKAMAEAMHISRKTMSAFVNGRGRVTVDIAMRLSIVTRTTPDFWLNMQKRVDVWEELHDNADKYANIKPVGWSEDLLQTA